MKATLIPRKEAVTQVVSPAEPAKVMLKLTLHEARLIQALCGISNSPLEHLGNVYYAISDVIGEYPYEYINSVRKAVIAAKDSGGNINFSSQPRLLDLKRESEQE